MYLANIRGTNKFNIRVEGINELDAQFARIGKMPKKYLTKAAREGMAGSLAAVRMNAPTGKTGNLKKSIRKKLETPNKRNKGVYRLWYDPKFNDVFQRKLQAYMAVKLLMHIILIRSSSVIKRSVAK